jgi:hypothetical protein
MAEFGADERVYVENEWYDGPRAGVADVLGEPHRFKSLFDEEADEYTGTFLVWKINTKDLELELEQWLIFVDWNALYESGKVGTETHPGHQGLNTRWDEIEEALYESRSSVPPGAQRAAARVQFIEGQRHYELSGPAYTLSWKLL